MNIDTKLRIAILAVLAVILYILLPVSSRYEYRIDNSYGTGVFNIKPGEEPVSLSGSSIVVRRRKW